MPNKGLDSIFMHYGIRSEDMETIKSVCEKYDVNFDWLKGDILRIFHEAKMKNEELNSSKLQRIIKKALSKI